MDIRNRKPSDLLKIVFKGIVRTVYLFFFLTWAFICVFHNRYKSKFLCLK